MKLKKSEQIAFRVTPDEKQLAEQVAVELKTTAGALASALLDNFIEARKLHGSRLLWPPQFNYFPSSSKSVQEEIDTSH